MPEPYITCIVTIHGIGFQHAPEAGGQGYADGLHERLRVHLPHELSGDPVSEFGRPAGTGAVYVHSDWPPGSGMMEAGLKRLGVWPENDTSHRSIDLTGVPLVEEGRPVAHVALVYAGLEEREPHLGASLETLAKAIISHGQYATLPSLIHTGLEDLWAVVKHGRHGNDTPTPSLQVRDSTSVKGQPDSSGALDILKQLDADVATYVCRNDLRERVRSFVHDAVLRLCFRPDVKNVVVNAHSQGTVLGFDVLRTLPPIAVERMKWFVTAGSPLRKYTDIFYWGTDASCIYQMGWTNFWDDTDPVADPLIPAKGWRRGGPMPPSPGPSGLYGALSQHSGEPVSVIIDDQQVSNADHGAGGGLPAHNYWDNDEQFVRPLANIVRRVAEL